MINKTNFLYSKSAAARILGVSVYSIARFEVWAYVCFVHVKGQRPTFMSKKAFKQHFVDWRIEQSKWLCVAQVDREHYRVINPKKSTAYSVWAFEESFDCECEDYKNQVLIFNNGKACCKHCYAVLTWLGHNRLSDYISAQARAA
jgi:hypothetical protein